MIRTIFAALVLLGTVLLLGGIPTQAQDPKTLPTIKEIMRQANKPTGLYFTLQRDLNAATPDWAEAATAARELNQLVDALAKSRPEKGDAASWQKLTAEYSTHTKAIEQAVLRKDKAAALAASGKVAPNLCSTCHKAHR